MHQVHAKLRFAANILPSALLTPLKARAGVGTRNTLLNTSHTVGVTAWKPFASCLLARATHDDCRGRCSLYMPNTYYVRVIHYWSHIRFCWFGGSINGLADSRDYVGQLIEYSRQSELDESR